MEHSNDLVTNCKGKVNTCSVFNFRDEDKEIFRKLDFSVGIVYTCWNKEWINTMVKKIVSKLEEYNAKILLEEVPGAYEIPLACKKMKTDIVIAVGVVLKGETTHYEYICESVYKGLMDVQLQTNIPIINGVLTCLTKEQVEDRVNSTLPEDWALSALKLIKNSFHFFLK